MLSKRRVEGACFATTGRGPRDARRYHPAMTTPSTSTARASIVGHIAIKDAAKWALYLAGVPATLAPWNAEVVMRGRQALALNGVQHGTDLVVIRFPDLAAVTAWYESEAYRALIPLRDEAADVVLAAYAI